MKKKYLLKPWLSTFILTLALKSSGISKPGGGTCINSPICKEMKNEHKKKNSLNLYITS